MKTRKLPAAASNSTAPDRKDVLASSGRLGTEPSISEHIPLVIAVARLENQVGDPMRRGS